MEQKLKLSLRRAMELQSELSKVQQTLATRDEELEQAQGEKRRLLDQVRSEEKIPEMRYRDHSRGRGRGRGRGRLNMILSPYEVNRFLLLHFHLILLHFIEPPGQPQYGQRY